jgi:hypothetical protein
MKHTPGPCGVKSCEAYNIGYEYNCELNGFMFAIGKCNRYEIERATGSTINQEDKTDDN